MRVRIFIVIVLFGLFISCKKEKKYPEDPKKSRMTPRNRLTGKWVINDYTFNENSIVSSLNALSNKYIITNFKFTYEYNNSYKTWDFAITDDATRYFYQSENGFIDDSYIYILGGTSDTIVNKWFISPFKFISPSSVNWTVTKLYDKDLHITLDTDSGQYKIFLKKL